MVLYALCCVSNVLALPGTTRIGSWETNLCFLRGVLSQQWDGLVNRRHIEEEICIVNDIGSDDSISILDVKVL
jgi:hypothetical protein